MISQTAEYALQAVVFLASQQRVAHTTAEISAATQTPSNYLSKVMQSLTRAGIVSAQRGLHGGFTLIRSPSQLTALEVVDAVEDSRRTRTCLWAREAEPASLCPLRQLMDDAIAAVEEVFRSVTIEQLLDGDQERPLHRYPCMALPGSTTPSPAT